MMALLGEILLHLLWQGTLVGLATALALRLTGYASRLRYRLALVALALVAMAPLATSARRAGLLGGWGLVIADRPIERGTALPGARPDDVKESGSLAPEAPEASAAGLATHAVRQGKPLRLDVALAGLGTMWLAGVAVLLTRLVAGIVQVHRVRASAAPAPVWLGGTVRELEYRSGSRRDTPVLVTDRSDVPFAVGILRPAVLLPAGLPDDLSVEQVRVVLAHELAHVRRHDYAVNLGQCVVEALMWFHPAVHWLSKVAREEREHCCDELAADVVGDRRAVAGALLALEESRGSDGFQSLLPAAAGGSLLARIERLLAVGSAGRLRWAATATMVCLAGGGTMLLATPARSVPAETGTIPAAAGISARVGGRVDPGGRVGNQVPGSKPTVPERTARDESPVVWTGELHPGERLRVRNIVGPIHVRRATGSSGIVRARLSGTRLPDLSFQATRQDDGVTICALRAAHGRCDAEGYTWVGPLGAMSRDWIELTVELPPGVSVTAATFDGDLDLDDIEADAEARTGTGWIDARIVESSGRRSDRTFDLHTGAGRVRVAIPSALGGELEARLSHGRVLIDPPISLHEPLSSRLRTKLGPGNHRLRVSSGGGDLVLTRR